MGRTARILGLKRNDLNEPSSRGWCVRESLMVYLLAGHETPAQDALMPSVTLGVLALLTTIPGSIVLEPDGRASIRCPSLQNPTKKAKLASIYTACVTG